MRFRASGAALEPLGKPVAFPPLGDSHCFRDAGRADSADFQAIALGLSQVKYLAKRVSPPSARSRNRLVNQLFGLAIDDPRRASAAPVTDPKLRIGKHDKVVDHDHDVLAPIVIVGEPSAIARVE